MFNRTQVMFFILGGFFITNALLAEIVGGKIFSVAMPEFLQSLLASLGFSAQDFKLSIGVVLWPVVFVATDLVNEFFGRRGVRFYTYVTIGLISYAFIALYLAQLPTSIEGSPIDQESFNRVFGTSRWIIVGSITAFAVSQLIDVYIFSKVRAKTGARYLWARATGSTAVSQLIDTFIVGGVGLYLPGFISFSTYLEISIVTYLFKLGVAVAATPLCYMGHSLIAAYLGEREAQELSERAAREKPKNWYWV